MPARRRKATFVFDDWLFATTPDHGTSAWDVATGERVCHDPTLSPVGYHPRARHFLSLRGNGRAQTSALTNGD